MISRTELISAIIGCFPIALCMAVWIVAKEAHTSKVRYIISGTLTTLFFWIAAVLAYLAI